MFNHNKFSDLDLHKMRSTEYTDTFGEPFRTTNLTTSDGKYKQVWYHSSIRDYLVGNVSRRNLLLEFKDDELNAYIYASSFDEDKTQIDLTKVDQIKIGTSSKNDIFTLLGKPYGKAICPSVLVDFKDNCAKATEIWAWLKFDKTGSIAGNDPRGRKSLFIMFDASGRVIDIKATANE
jgi:hypothetical protein